MASDLAVTVADAARSLGVSTQRVHQMLKEGRLAGPEVFSDRRAPPNVPRVWTKSVAAEAARRVDGQRLTSRRPRAANTPVTAAPTPSPSSEAAYRLKIALDAARDNLKAERAQTARVTRLLGEAVAALEEQQRLAERSEHLADGYSEALTQLIGPTDPGDIKPGALQPVGHERC